MSFIIEFQQNQKIFKTSCSIINPQSQKIYPYHFKNLQPKIKNHIFKQNQLNTASFYQFSFNNNNLSIIYTIQSTHKHIFAIVKFQIKKNHQVQLVIKLINKDQNYTLINSKQRRKLVTKLLTQCFNSCLYFTQFKICINIYSGQIILKSPILHIINIDHRILEANFLAFNRYLYTYLTNKQYQISQLFQFSNEPYYVYGKKIIDNSLFNNNYQNICRYIKLSSTYLFHQQQTHAQRKIKELKQKQQKSFIKIKKNIKIQNQIKYIQFYLINPHQKENLHNQYKITENQKKKLYKKIEQPYTLQYKQFSQHNYVLNFIKRKNSYTNKQTQMKKIGKGGFSTLWQIQLQYQHVSSHKLNIQSQHWEITSQLFKNKFALKRQDPDLIKSGIISRISHQKNILTKIKFCSSIYLPKFYILSDKNDCLQQDLIMEYIKYPTLGQFIRKNRQTSSIFTKLQIIVNLAQGLRSLKEYNIVHLDIKPSNVMLSMSNLIKIIDFGQSYHPQIANHRPGLSMPFSAPQNYKSSIFSQKNDVFSVGVILYMIIMGQRLPYYIYSERDRYFYDRWFFCIQQNINYGKTNMIVLLQSVILRLMHKKPQDRANLQWVVILISQIFDCYK